MVSYIFFLVFVLFISISNEALGDGVPVDCRLDSSHHKNESELEDAHKNIHRGVCTHQVTDEKSNFALFSIAAEDACVYRLTTYPNNDSSSLHRYLGQYYGSFVSDSCKVESFYELSRLPSDRDGDAVRDFTYLMSFISESSENKRSFNRNFKKVGFFDRLLGGFGRLRNAFYDVIEGNEELMVGDVSYCYVENVERFDSDCFEVSVNVFGHGSWMLFVAKDNGRLVAFDFYRYR